MKVVLDTNIIISALVFANGRLTWIRHAWINREISPLTNKVCIEELIRALAYPKFKLSQPEIESLLGEYLPYIATVPEHRVSGKKMPRCSDPNDQKFLELAYTGNAELLITGDRALLALKGRTPFEIVTPAEFHKRVTQK